MITQQQALEALESVYGAVFRAHGSQAYKVLRQYIEQSAPGDVVMVNGKSSSRNLETTMPK